LEAVGGFPVHSIFGEDTIVAARMLLAGWKIAYVAEAQAFHSHSYSWSQEFRRYFDIGVLHSRESWLLEQFGNVRGEGKRFVCSELKFLYHARKTLIPSALVRTMAKFVGYRLGRMEAKLSPKLKYRFSMHRFFWNY
jgi:rhamnosyltransferase